MINCPKCQVPNPDSATVCAACGTTLVGQQFAQALDQAMGAPPQGQQPQMPGAQPGAQFPAAPMMPPQMGQAQPQFDLPPGFDGSQAVPGMDPGMAQAEINRFMAAQKAKKRTKTIIYLLIFAVIAGVAAFFIIQSSRKKARTEAVAAFYQTFNKIDDDSVGAYFRCTVRASGMDIHKADNTQVLTDGLEKAFNNFAKTQADWLRNKCSPLLKGSIEELEKLKAPDGFAAAMDGLKSALREVGSTFDVYAAMIEKRKNEAADEQEIRDMNGDFHRAVEDKEAKKALAYVNWLRCVLPDVVKLAKGVKQPPDTQPVVEHIYNTCKADPKFADKLRKECFTTRNDDQKKGGDFNVLVNRMSGDARDLEAINDCFRRANKGFALKELEAVAKVFIKYNDARGKVREEMKKVKDELSDKK